MKIKKIYLALTLALICILGVTVNAEEGNYAPGENSYTNSITEGAKTVLIYKGSNVGDVTGENIYYIDQTNDTEGFANLEMLMKRDAPAGEYTVVVDGGNTAKFTISDAQAFVSGATKVKFLGAQLQSDSSYSVAYGIDVKNSYSATSKLTMIIGEKAYTMDMFGDASIIEWVNGMTYTENEQGEKELMFAIQIDGVGEEYITKDESGNVMPGFDLYFK